MGEFWILILILFFGTNLMDKSEAVQLEELPLPTFDELFVDEWWDKDEAENLKTPPTIFGKNVHHQIDRQNTQLGQIEPNSTDQNLPLTEFDHFRQFESNSTNQNPPLTESDHFGQIEPNSTDQNLPLTEFDHSENTKNGEELIAEDERKRTIIDKFHAMKNEFKQKYSNKERNQIEEKIAKHLKVSRKKIYKWKKELGISGNPNGKEQRKHLVEKFDQMKAELKRAGFKNSQNELDKTVAKELGLSDRTIYKWKRELGQTTPQHNHKELMIRYYEIKGNKIHDKDIAKSLNISRFTLCRWKKQFKRQQFHLQ